MPSERDKESQNPYKSGVSESVKRPFPWSKFIATGLLFSLAWIMAGALIPLPTPDSVVRTGSNTLVIYAEPMPAWFVGPYCAALVIGWTFLWFWFHMRSWASQ